MATEFRLPDLGENIEAGEVLNVLVSAGQTLSEDEPVIELETDKAVIEVPSSTAGKVVSVHVAKGDRAAVGQVILTLEPSGDTEPAGAAPAAEAPKAEDIESPPPAAPADKESAGAEAGRAAATGGSSTAPEPTAPTAAGGWWPVT